MDSLLSNPPPIESSCTSLPRTFDSPPCGEPLLPSTSNKILAPPFDDAFHILKFTLNLSDQVISLYKFYKNAKDIGKLAVALVKYTYFGLTIIAQSTVTGRGDVTGLDPIKLRLLQGNITAIFPQKDDDKFGISAWIQLHSRY